MDVEDSYFKRSCISLFLGSHSVGYSGSLSVAITVRTEKHLCPSASFSRESLYETLIVDEMTF